MYIRDYIRTSEGEYAVITSYSEVASTEGSEVHITEVYSIKDNTMSLLVASTSDTPAEAQEKHAYVVNSINSSTLSLEIQ